jgi:hypothetical protein
MKTKQHATTPQKNQKTETEYEVDSKESIGDVANYVLEWAVCPVEQERKWQT